MIRFYRPERPSVWRDLLTFYFRTWRQGWPMLAVGPVLWIYALILEIAR